MNIETMSIEEIEGFFENLEICLVENQIKELIRIFLSDTRPNDRNRIAIILSDYGKNLAVNPIIEMLNNPITKGNRGTLLYALTELNYSEHLEFIFSLLYEEGFEVKREALLLIEKTFKEENYNANILKMQIPLLIEKITNLSENISFYISVLELFSKQTY